MIYTPTVLPDFTSLTEVVPLSESAIDWAIRLCQRITDSEAQWHCYLRSLAIMGVKQWLQEGGTPYDMQFDQRQLPDSTTVLNVNGVRVGVVPIGSLPPDTFVIPQSTMVGAESIHLWLLADVQEELGQVRVVQAMEGCHVAGLATAITASGDYELPLTAFTLSPEQALFYLYQFSPTLEPATQSLTQSAAQAVTQSAAQSTAQAAAQTVTQAAAQSAESPAGVPLGTRVMNVGRWLQDQLDDVAQQFAWTLLEPLTPAMAMRSPTQALEAILMELEPQGLTIPSRARAAFTEVLVDDCTLRLYALIWNVFEGDIPEWTLIVFLGPSPENGLPSGLALRIRDGQAVLTEQTFSDGSEATYLYAQVFGTWDESFTVDILPPHSETPLTLPAFSFQPNA